MQHIVRWEKATKSIQSTTIFTIYHSKCMMSSFHLVQIYLPGNKFLKLLYNCQRILSVTTFTIVWIVSHEFHLLSTLSETIKNKQITQRYNTGDWICTCYAWCFFIYYTKYNLNNFPDTPHSWIESNLIIITNPLDKNAKPREKGHWKSTNYHWNNWATKGNHNWQQIGFRANTDKC